MEAKDYQEIVDTADCNAEANYVGAGGKYKVLGWARRLIRVSSEAGYEQASRDLRPQLVSLAELCRNHRQAGIKEVVEWVRQYGIHGGNIKVGDMLEDMRAHSEFGIILKKGG